MTTRRALCLLLTVAVPLLLAGCVAGPLRFTVYGEHSDTETTGGLRRALTSGNKVGVSASCELTQSR